MWRAVLGFVFVVMLLGIGGGAARADDDAAFRQTVDDAMEHYKAKRYGQAIQAFEAAYKLRAEPELVYNIARSYEKSLKRTEAIDAYNRFLELPGTTAELRANALSAVDALKKEQALTKRASTAADDGGSTRDLGQPTRAQAAVQERSHTTEWVLIGGGLGVAAIGGVFTALAFKANSDFDAAPTRDEKIGLRDDTRRNALVADVMVGVGLVSAAVGAGLLIFGGDSAEERVAVAPSLGDGGAGLSVFGTF